MKKNRNGQVMMFRLMVLVAVILVALILINPLKSVITDVKDTDQLDCDNSSISFEEQAACLEVGLLLPYFIGAIIIFGFAYYFSRKAGIE